jgi:acetyl-CoA carboxylase biotin carboxylase subunit
MIAKVIAHADTRKSAIDRMRIALSEMVIEGIKTNQNLHFEIMQHNAFRKGSTNIHYLEKRLGL